MICTSQPIPLHLSSFHFDIQINNAGEDDRIIFGLSTNNVEKGVPGTSLNTIGFRGEDGQIWHKNEKVAVSSAEHLTEGETVCCNFTRIKSGKTVQALNSTHLPGLMQIRGWLWNS